MAEVTQAKVVAALKKLGTAEKLPAESKIAAELGIEIKHVAKTVWPFEHIAFPELEIKSTEKTIGKKVVAARAAGIRWERIAHRTGKTISEVKAAYTAESGEDAGKSYTGRGKPPEGTAPASGKPAAGKPAAAGRGRGTSGRRQAAAKPAAADKPKPAGRGRGKVADPS